MAMVPANKTQHALYTRSHTRTQKPTPVEPPHLYIDFLLANQLLSRGCGDSLTHEARLAARALARPRARARTLTELATLQPLGNAPENLLTAQRESGY